MAGRGRRSRADGVCVHQGESVRAIRLQSLTNGRSCKSSPFTHAVRTFWEPHRQSFSGRLHLGHRLDGAFYIRQSTFTTIYNSTFALILSIAILDERLWLREPPSSQSRPASSFLASFLRLHTRSTLPVSLSDHLLHAAPRCAGPVQLVARTMTVRPPSCSVPLAVACRPRHDLPHHATPATAAGTARLAWLPDSGRCRRRTGRTSRSRPCAA
jgi:hypothetical protein